jgi:hypothetical protein
MVILLLDGEPRRLELVTPGLSLFSSFDAPAAHRLVNNYPTSFCDSTISLSGDPFQESAFGIAHSERDRIS